MRKDELPHVQVLEPGALGPSTVSDEHGNLDPWIVLGPNTGVWVPKLHTSPGRSSTLPGQASNRRMGGRNFCLAQGFACYYA